MSFVVSSSSLVVALLSFTFLSCTVLSGCSSHRGPTDELEDNKSSKEGKLVLLLVADQFAQSYLETHRGIFRSGLKELLDKGLVFRNASHDHALTSTCPGHATIATGFHPRDHGIIENYWFDTEDGEVVYCVEGKKGIESPEALLKPTMGDLVKQRLPASKVFSVSGKDRAAITLGGKLGDGAFWYDKNKGYFVTSSYYSPPKELPKMIKNATKASTFFGSTWQSKLNERDYPRIVNEIQQDHFHLSFPYAFGKPSITPDREFYGDIYRSPYLDTLTYQAASTILKSQKLGRLGSIDVLAVSFSALDTLGHVFGPESREVAEVLIHLDELIGRLLEEARLSVGEENLVVAFSSDHGVAPIPEVEKRDFHKRSRETWQDVVCVQEKGKKLSERLGRDDLFLGYFYLNPALQEEIESKLSEITVALKNELEQCPHVKKVWALRELSPDLEDEFGRLYYNSLNPDRSPDFIMQPTEHHIDVRLQGTNHGTPYSYDRDVPMIFMHPKISRGYSDSEVRTIDITPTLLELLGGGFQYQGEGVSLID